MSTRRVFLRAGLGAGLEIGALAGSTMSAAFAQGYPSRPVTVVVPFPAGSGTDTASRDLGRLLEQHLGAPIVVENKGGANGSIGAQYVARQKGDGYTLLVGGNSTHSANPILYRKIGYDPVGDFVPVASTIVSAPVLLAGPSTSVKNLSEVIALARSRPGGLNFASANASGLFTTRVFMKRANLDFAIAPYVSPPQAHLELAAGRIDFMFGDFGAGYSLLRAGKLRPLAVATSRRLSTYPDVPTLAEAGLSGVECELWNGVFAPRGVAASIVVQLNAAIGAALRDASFIASVGQAGQEPRISSPGEFAAYVQGQFRHWQEMAALIGYEPE